MSEASFVELINPATREVNKLEERIGDKVQIRRIGRGGRKPDLEKVFEQSLLGFRISGCKVDETSLSAYEKLVKEKDDMKVKVVLDFDGVVISPSHFQRNVGYVNVRWLKRLVKVSNSLTIWTNRRQPENGPLSKTGTFPFLGSEVKEKVLKVLNRNPNDPEKAVNEIEEKAEIRKKDLKDNGNSLKELGEGYDLLIFIGSGRIDRKAVEMYVKNGGDPEKLIYFDTGHLIL